MSSVRIRLLQTESFRHAALYAAIFAGAMALLIAIVYFILDHSFKANLFREINDDLTSIRTAYETARPGREEHEAKEIIDDRLLAPDEDDVFLLQRGTLKLAGNLPAMPVKVGLFSMRLPASAGAAASSGAHVIMGRGVMLSSQDYAFVGRDMHQVNETERGILVTFGFILVASLVLALVGAVLLSRIFLLRVDAITRTCQSIVAGRFGERIPVAETNNEFTRLGHAINGMLDRIQVLMDSLRQVSTDIAHDLRTPLTHLRHRLERVRTEALTPRDYVAAVDGAVAECDNLLAIFTALLRIAQIEAGARRAAFRSVNLKQLVEQARDIYGPVMEDAKRNFLVSAASAPDMQGDRQLLLQLIFNLLDNAIKHAPAGTEVELSCGERDGRPLLSVADCGPGIPEAERQKVLRRFYRCEQSRTTSGSGLGLSLVAAVAELHEASLSLASNEPGLRVTVLFPAGE